MNLGIQQLSQTGPLAGFTLGQSVARRLAEPLADATVASLQRDQMVTAEVARLAESPAIKDLRVLREEERNTESPITLHAFSRATTLLEFAQLVLGDLPRTLLVPSGEGGITIEWFRDDRTVRVIIPPRANQAAYIYQRVGRESDIKPFSNSSVIQTLRSVILTP